VDDRHNVTSSIAIS